MKGPIRPNPVGLIVCVHCSRLFSTEEKPVRYGVRTRDAAQHLRDHRAGRIRRPIEAKA